MISYKFRLLILCLIAFAATMLIFNSILKIAKTKNIVDNPDARKLQKEPVPVMGGIAVFFGIVVGLCFYKTMIVYTTLFPVLGAMIVMLYIGAIDDILSIRPWVRLVIELLVSLLLIYGLKCCITGFHGLWGIERLPLAVGIPLSVLTFVGVVNSINMIDGIDGLSSAFCILVLACLGVICFLARDYSFSVLAAVSIGALLPFLLHNVFGLRTKMFIGDGGTMMIGAIISAMIFITLRDNSGLTEFFPQLDFCLPAFVLAVLSIPVADTLRVMASRIKHRRSPFSPDKTHLHHYFVGNGYSYVWVTILEILMDIIVIGLFFLVWALGASDDVQLYVVIVSAALLDIGVVRLLGKAQEGKGALAGAITSLARKSHVERRGIWLSIQKLIDNDR